MAYKKRVTLINRTGKDAITLLQVEHPAYQWYVTLKEGREVIVGVKGGKVAIIGPTYESIKDNLSL